MADLPLDAIRAAMTGFCDYFEQVAAHRRARPRDDLASAIANASVGGKPMPDFERVSYYILMATAGHDTTSFAIAGGLHALIEHPAQLARLKREPGLLGSAVEEMLRWTSPVRHFMRTAAQACELGGTRLRAGDAVCLFFNSANRDETVFANAEAFRIDRSPNPHIAFGRGAHLCLGHHLARMEMRALFAELLPRLDHVEAAGPTDRARSAFVAGVKSLPIRYRLRAAPDRR